MADFTIKIVGDSGPGLPVSRRSGDSGPPATANSPTGQKGQPTPFSPGQSPGSGSGSGQQQQRPQRPQPKTPTIEEQMAERRKKLLDIASSQGMTILSSLGLGGLISKVVGQAGMLAQIKNLMTEPFKVAPTKPTTQPVQPAPSRPSVTPTQPVQPAPSTRSSFTPGATAATGAVAASSAASVRNASASVIVMTQLRRSARGAALALDRLRRAINRMMRRGFARREADTRRGQIIDVAGRPSLPPSSRTVLLPRPGGRGLVPRGGPSTFIPANVSRSLPAVVTRGATTVAGATARGAGAAAAGAAGGAGGTAVAAGGLGAFGALAGVAVAAVAVIGVFMGLRAAVRNVIADLKEMTKRAAAFSPDIAKALQEQESRARDRDRLIAQMAGPELANFQRMQNNMEDMLDRIKIGFYTSLLKAFGPTLDFLGSKAGQEAMIQGTKLALNQAFPGLGTVIEWFYRMAQQPPGPSDLDVLFKRNPLAPNMPRPFAWRQFPGGIPPAPGFNF